MSARPRSHRRLEPARRSAVGGLSLLVLVTLAVSTSPSLGLASPAGRDTGAATGAVEGRAVPTPSRPTQAVRASVRPAAASTATVRIRPLAPVDPERGPEGSRSHDLLAPRIRVELLDLPPPVA
jgi:hypothetical protein